MAHIKKSIYAKIKNKMRAKGDNIQMRVISTKEREYKELYS
ncbi:hypothetical protein GCM10027435_30700 [Haloparvum alkalitolerans]